MYAGELTYRLPLHECISHIYLYCRFLFTPLLMIERKGENDFEFIHAYLEIEFMHILSLCMYWVHACSIFYVYTKKRRRILKVYTKRWRKILQVWWVLCMFISLYMDTCLFNLRAFIVYLFVYCYAWVKGELLWSLTLIYVYNSMSFVIIKKGNIVDPRPITLILMMINS